MVAVAAAEVHQLEVAAVAVNEAVATKTVKCHRTDLFHRHTITTRYEPGQMGRRLSISHRSTSLTTCRVVSVPGLASNSIYRHITCHRTPTGSRFHRRYPSI